MENKMNLRKEIKLKDNEDAVSVEIKSIQNTFGSFVFSFYDKGEFEEIFRGDFGDKLPDIFTLPYKAKYLKGHALSMLGNFAPDPAVSNDILFVINFIQEGEVVDSVSVNLPNTPAETIEITMKLKHS